MNKDILEQESLVIGVLLNNADLFTECDLQPSDFSSTEHRQYYECVQKAAAKNNLNPFEAREIFRNETGVNNDLMLDYSTSSLWVKREQFLSFVERIKKESHKNKALMITSNLIENLQKGNTDFIGEAISNLMNVNKADEKYDHSFEDVGVMVVDAFERAEKGETGAVSTGFADIDECLGGWHPSDLVIIAARPAMGKTAFMVNSFLKANKSVGVISAEQGAEQIGVRSVCIEGGVNHQNFRRAKMEKPEFNRFRSALDEFRMMKSRLFDKPAPTIMEVEKIARQWVFKHDVKAIFIDYAQRLGHENTKLNPVERNSDIAKRLKELARTLNVPVIALAQVNRQCESRNDKRPMMGDIADASAYEKEADVIFTLYRDEVYTPETEDKGIIEAIFEKNRHGSTGKVKLKWIGQFMQVNDFNEYEYSQDEYEQQAGGYF